MDKSFNDQELSDIMKEIEALEDDFTTEDKASPVMEDLANMDLKDSIPEKTSEVVEMDSFRAPAAKKETSAPAAGTSMSFKVQGNMTLDLEFNIGGKVVAVQVTETGLSIEMDGGATFTVPVAGKKAA